MSQKEIELKNILDSYEEWKVKYGEEENHLKNALSKVAIDLNCLAKKLELISKTHKIKRTTN